MKQPTHSLLIDIFGDFNAGWIHYVLGLEKPTNPVMAEGYEMGEETPSLQSMRRIMEAERNLPKAKQHYTVKSKQAQ